jgi:hypothetical protein
MKKNSDFSNVKDYSTEIKLSLQKKVENAILKTTQNICPCMLVKKYERTAVPCFCAQLSKLDKLLILNELLYRRVSHRPML